jgi:DMSO reductase anchor subunit/ferredoxin
MGCNHCLEPSCLIGCPVQAYTKDPVTGVVIHSADTCIGCQYCTWNCSYGVPQFNEERGVVGKCDMCHHRISDGDAPACVGACPEGAIAIEIVDIAEWRKNYLTAESPGLPSASDSISTTRVTLPENLLPETGRVDTGRVTLEHPHWPLVFMLVVTQLSVGAFTVLWLLERFGTQMGLFLPAFAALGLAGMSLGASTIHLGRPAYAFRAIKGLRTSWLSREVLTLSLFAGAASAYAALVFLDQYADVVSRYAGILGPYAGLLLAGQQGRTIAGIATVLFGVAGITSSARIYIVKARPAWNSLFTVADYFSTALLLGPLFIRAMGFSDSAWTAWAAAAGAGAQLLTQLVKYRWLNSSQQFELQASALLLGDRLRGFFLLRLGILAIAAVGALAQTAPVAIATLVLALGGEWLGRWLFFVSVVPKNMAAAFTGGRVAA